MTYLEFKDVLDLASNVNKLLESGILAKKNGNLKITPAGQFLAEIIEQEQKEMDVERNMRWEEMTLKEKEVQYREEDALRKVKTCVGIIVAETIMVITMAAILAFN